MMPKVQIVVSVQGGVVQDVFCSADEAELIMVDWDTDGCDPSDRDVARLAEPDGDERLAFVSKCLTEPLETLAGTDVEAAIQYAQAHAFRNFENEPVISKPNSA
jgi:hypothetical protein